MNILFVLTPHDCSMHSKRGVRSCYPICRGYVSLATHGYVHAVWHTRTHHYAMYSIVGYSLSSSVVLWFNIMLPMYEKEHLYIKQFVFMDIVFAYVDPSIDAVFWPITASELLNQTPISFFNICSQQSYTAYRVQSYSVCCTGYGPSLPCNRKSEMPSLK